MTEHNQLDGAPDNSGVSRRTVTKAMAWAVPVIAIAAPVPAFAASGGIIEIANGGCKLPGNSQGIYKGYIFKMTATNNTDFEIEVTIDSAFLDGQDLGAVTVVNLATCTTIGNPFTIPADTMFASLALLTQNAPNSQNGDLVVNFTITGGGEEPPATATASGLNPIQGASCGDFTQAEKDCIALLFP